MKRARETERKSVWSKHGQPEEDRDRTGWQGEQRSKVNCEVEIQIWICLITVFNEYVTKCTQENKLQFGTCNGPCAMGYTLQQIYLHVSLPTTL